MLAIWLALIGALLNAVSKIIFRSVLRADGNPQTIIILNNLCGAALFILFKGMPDLSGISLDSALRILLSTLLWTLATIGDINSSRHLDAAVNGIFGTLRYVILALLCVIIFGEHITAFGILGIILIVASVIFTADLKSITFRTGAKYRLMAVIFCNLALLNEKSLLTYLNPDIIILFAFLGPGLIASLIYPKDVLAVPAAVVKSRGWMLLAAVFQVVIFGVHVYAMKLTDLVITATIHQTSVVFTFVLGVFVLKERDFLLRRGMAAVMCAIGAAMVSIK